MEGSMVMVMVMVIFWAGPCGILGIDYLLTYLPARSCHIDRVLQGT